MLEKKISYKIKNKIIKSKKQFDKNIKNFFDWVKGAELIELYNCEIEKDPVRPELDLEFRTSYGRKIYGVKYKKEIHAVMCLLLQTKFQKLFMN